MEPLDELIYACSKPSLPLLRSTLTFYHFTPEQLAHPLLLACMQGIPDFVFELLKVGALPSISAVVLAAREKHADILDMFLEMDPSLAKYAHDIYNRSAN
jgi:hypothetical protein